MVLRFFHLVLTIRSASFTAEAASSAKPSAPIFSAQFRVTGNSASRNESQSMELRIGKRFPVHHVDAVWAVQRLHDDAKTLRRYEDFWPERLAVSRRHGGRLVSPLLIRRYIRSPRGQRVLGRAVSAAYAVAGKRPD